MDVREMAKYIDRDALVEWLKRIPLKDLSDGRGLCRVIFEDDFKRAIKKIPKGIIVDVFPVRHGRWMYTKKHLWYKNKDGSIDKWRLDIGFHNGPECQVCGEAVCIHCYPDWESMECETGHYLCSVCGEVSIDAHENYCPNCGTDMRGSNDE